MDKMNFKKCKRGSELAQTVLITAVMVVVVATIFFPQIKGIFSTALESVSGLFNDVLANSIK